MNSMKKCDMCRYYRALRNENDEIRDVGECMCHLPEWAVNRVDAFPREIPANSGKARTCRFFYDRSVVPRAPGTERVEAIGRVLRAVSAVVNYEWGIDNMRSNLRMSEEWQELDAALEAMEGKR